MNIVLHQLESQRKKPRKESLANHPSILFKKKKTNNNNKKGICPVLQHGIVFICSVKLVCISQGFLQANLVWATPVHFSPDHAAFRYRLYSVFLAPLRPPLACCNTDTDATYKPCTSKVLSRPGHWLLRHTSLALPARFKLNAVILLPQQTLGPHSHRVLTDRSIPKVPD